MWQTKTIISHYYSAYEHQTLQGGNLPWGVRIVVINCPFNLVMLIYYVTN